MVTITDMIMVTATARNKVAINTSTRATIIHMKVINMPMNTKKRNIIMKNIIMRNIITTTMMIHTQMRIFMVSSYTYWQMHWGQLVLSSPVFL